MKNFPHETRNLLPKKVGLAEIANEFAVDPATRTPFTRLVAVMTELPAERIPELLRCLDPGKLARQMARASHVMDCSFFLSQCRRAAVHGSVLDKAKVQRFGIDFISTLHAQSTFLDELRGSDIATVKAHLQVVGEFSPALRNTVENGLGPDSWAMILLRSSLQAIGRYIYHVASMPLMARSSKDEQMCRTVLHDLAGGVLRRKGTELYERTSGMGEAQPLVALGRLFWAIAIFRKNTAATENYALSLLNALPIL